MEGRPVAFGLDEIREVIVYPVSRPRHVLDIPYVGQKPDLCGEACVEMVTTFLGRLISQDKVNEAGGLDGKRGCHAEELITALRKLDVKIVSEKSWPGVTDDDSLAERGRLIACLHDPGRWPQWELSIPAFVHHRKNASGRLCQVEFALFRTWKTAAGAAAPGRSPTSSPMPCTSPTWRLSDRHTRSGFARASARCTRSRPPGRTGSSAW